MYIYTDGVDNIMLYSDTYRNNRNRNVENIFQKMILSMHLLPIKYCDEEVLFLSTAIMIVSPIILSIILCSYQIFHFRDFTLENLYLPLYSNIGGWTNRSSHLMN